MDDLARLCCLNPDCTLHARRDAGNLSVCVRYGKRNHIRLHYCKACKYRFSERKGAAFFRSHLPQEKALAVLEHLDEGCGIRSTGRLVGVDPNTVVRFGRIAGQHARNAHDGLVAFSPSDERGPIRREVVVRRQETEAMRLYHLLR